MQSQDKTRSALFLGVLLLLLVTGLTVCGGLYYWQQAQAPPPAGPTSDDVLDVPAPATEVGEENVEYSLAEEEREYLWDIEHHNNVLGKYGFSKVIESWQGRDRAQLLSMFDPQFQGQLLPADEASVLSAETPLLNVSRHTAVAELKLEANREQFADWLLELRDEFSDDPAPKARFDVMLLTPPPTHTVSSGSGSDSDAAGPDNLDVAAPGDASEGIWEAKCQVRMWGTGRDGGPAEVKLRIDLTTHTLSEERLAESGWLAGSRVQQIDIGHVQHPMFADVTGEVGIDASSLHDNWRAETTTINTGGLYACDYNRDGYTDLWITDIGSMGNRFYVGGPNGKFQESTRQVGLKIAQNTTIAAFADLDNDGWEDLLLPRTGRVFRNEGGERFREVTADSNLGAIIQQMPAPARYIAGVVPGDFDRDGLIDLYVTRAVPPIRSWLQSRQPDLIANQLLRNEGNLRFSDVTEATGTGGGGVSCFAAVWTDVDNDRWPDLYVINEFGNGALLANQEGKKFEERKLLPTQNDFGSMGLTCGDVDNDGLTDLYVSNMYSKAGSRIMSNMKAEGYPEDVKQRLRHMVAGGELYKNQGALEFDALGKDYQVHDAGWAWGPSLADLDNDGWLDLHVTAGFISRDRAKPDG